MAKLDVTTLQSFNVDEQSSPQWKMFADCLPHAVAEVPENRHKFQSELLEMMNSELEESRMRTAKSAAEAEESLEAARTELNTRKRKAQDAKEEQESATQNLESQSLHLSEVRSAVADAETCHKPVDKQKATAEAKKTSAQEERDQATAVRDGMLAMLRSGGWEEDADGQEDAIDHVTKFLKDIRAEDTLVAACPGVFRVRPEKRRRFDNVVDQGVAEAVDKRIAELEDALEKIEAKAEDVQAEALGLWAILDCARDKVREAEKDVESAKAAQAEANALCATMNADVSEQEGRIQDLDSTQKLQSEKIDAHVVALEALERLRRYEYDVLKVDEPIKEADMLVETKLAPLEAVVGNPLVGGA